MKKLILLIAVLMAVTLLFAACTKPGDGQETSTKASEVTTKEEVTTASKPAETHEDEVGKSFSELHPAD